MKSLQKERTQDAQGLGPVEQFTIETDRVGQAQSQSGKFQLKSRSKNRQKKKDKNEKAVEDELDDVDYGLEFEAQGMDDTFGM